MIFWLIAGILSALATGALTTPLYKKHRWLALLLVILIPLAALGLYLLTGNPDLTK